MCVCQVCNPVTLCGVCQGLAYTGTLCDTNGKSASIVEDLGGFQCIGTAAHELGHG